MLRMYVRLINVWIDILVYYADVKLINIVIDCLAYFFY